MPNTPFDYNKAFSRNIGWLTPNEQLVVRYKKVAIAGLGGVGGNHLITLTRLGVGKFNISDFDNYDIPNFNRQIGASMETVGLPKLDVLSKQVKAINPEITIDSFPAGINKDNVDEFLSDVDLYVDSLDFFVLGIRRLIFSKCAEKGIPAITAAPLGMGCAFLAFLPDKMTFEEYFRLEGHDEKEQLIRFLVGLAPRALQNKYLVYPEAIDLVNHKGPSTPMAVELCAGIAATQALKILLRRGDVVTAPHGLHFDAYRNNLVNTWRPWGNDNPIQQLALIIGRKKFGQAYKTQACEEQQPESVIEKILDLARWAPSGDNGQPWRFQIIDGMNFIIRGFDTREEIVYDLQGHASQLAIGTLLETIVIVASSYGFKVQFELEDKLDKGQYEIKVVLIKENNLTAHPLVPYIKTRTVQRRSMDSKPLTENEKTTLQSALPEGYRIIWFETFKDRLKIAKILWKNAGLRLTLPEAFNAHKVGIEWECQYSAKHMPDQSLGVDKLTRKIMRWAMANWERVDFMNKYFGGTLLPRVQMDLIPSLRCSAHFIILADKQPKDIKSYINAGRCVQKFWLTATKIGLHLQPSYTPLVFSEYIRDSIHFTQSRKSTECAQSVRSSLITLLDENNLNKSIFMGRIGHGPEAISRSLRLPLNELVIKSGL